MSGTLSFSGYEWCFYGFLALWSILHNFSEENPKIVIFKVLIFTYIGLLGAAILLERRLGSHGRVMMGHETPLQALIVLPSLGFCGNSFLPSGRSLFPSFFLSLSRGFLCLHKSGLEIELALLSSHRFLHITEVSIIFSFLTCVRFNAVPNVLFTVNSLYYAASPLHYYAHILLHPRRASKRAHMCGNIIMLVFWTASFLIHDIQVN